MHRKIILHKPDIFIRSPFLISILNKIIDLQIPQCWNYDKQTELLNLFTINFDYLVLSNIWVALIPEVRNIKNGSVFIWKNIMNLFVQWARTTETKTQWWLVHSLYKQKVRKTLWGSNIRKKQQSFLCESWVTKVTGDRKKKEVRKERARSVAKVIITMTVSGFWIIHSISLRRNPEMVSQVKTGFLCVHVFIPTYTL